MDRLWGFLCRLVYVFPSFGIFCVYTHFDEWLWPPSLSAVIFGGSRDMPYAHPYVPMLLVAY